MPLADDQLKKVVTDTGLVGEEEFEAARRSAERRRRPVSEILVERGLINDQYLQELVAEFLGVGSVDLRRIPLDPNALALLTQADVVELKAVPFRFNADGAVDTAFLDPTDRALMEKTATKMGKPIVPHLTGRKSYLHALRGYQRDLAGEMRRVLEEHAAPQKGLADFPAMKIVDTVLAYAVMQSASDVHLEPLDDGLLVRFRVDGRLRDELELPAAAAPAILSRIKIMSNLKIDEHRLPQDGRISFIADGERIYVRVSIVPSVRGENVVMRILNEHEQTFSLSDLGLDDRGYETVQRAAKRPYGMILVTGPTGSGKTTTLYTILNMLNMEDVKIATIEDPVEYGLAHIMQTQVSTQVNYTFANGLRALLRQDPNVIMVGEIRDDETAQIAVQAGLTGHIILSTIHASDAVRSIPRLLDMQIKPLVLSSTLALVVAQRLVRRICPDCIESYAPTDDEAEAIVRDFGDADLIGTLREADIIAPDVKTVRELTLYRGKGCSRCGDMGYLGRVGLFEVMSIDAGMRRSIAASEPYDVIFNAARKAGMRTLEEDGWEKALSGMTTVEELIRVTRA